MDKDILVSVITIVICVAIVFGNLFFYFYKRKKNLPTGDCYYCQTKKQKILDEYYKTYKK